MIEFIDGPPPPVKVFGTPRRQTTYILHHESDPRDLEPLSVGTRVTAYLGQRDIDLYKTKRWGFPWHDYETGINYSNARAAQLGFRTKENAP